MSLSTWSCSSRSGPCLEKWWWSSSSTLRALFTLFQNYIRQIIMKPQRASPVQVISLSVLNLRSCTRPLDATRAEFCRFATGAAIESKFFLRKKEAAFETAYSMNRYTVSKNTYLTMTKRGDTQQPNLVKYECGRPSSAMFIYHMTDVASATTLKILQV